MIRPGSFLGREMRGDTAMAATVWPIARIFHTRFCRKGAERQRTLRFPALRPLLLPNNFQHVSRHEIVVRVLVEKLEVEKFSELIFLPLIFLPNPFSIRRE